MNYFILNEIENNYDVASIKINNIQVWPFLRMNIFFYLLAQENTDDKKQNNKKDLIEILHYFKQIFYGFTNWFRKYDGIVISTSILRFNIDGKYWDKNYDYLINHLEQYDLLYIEKPQVNHFNKNMIPTKYIVSNRLLDAVVYIYGLFYRPKIRLINENILKKILLDYKIRINYNKNIHRFLISSKIYSILFRIYRPKFIMVNCSYSYFPAIREARMRNIKIVEMQHGIIGNDHPAYHFNINLDEKFYPDYLLVYGDIEKKNLINSKFIKSEKIYSVGHFYLEYTKNNFKSDNSLANIIAQYKFSVAVTLQDILENELLDFIIRASVIDSSIVYIIIPRNNKESDYHFRTIPGNVIFYDSLNFYEIVNHCTYHTTIHSTCALEAPYFGKLNILYNYKKLASSRFELLLSEKSTVYVESINDYIQQIYINKNCIPDDVNGDIQFLFKNEFNNNILKFINMNIK